MYPFPIIGMLYSSINPRNCAQDPTAWFSQSRFPFLGFGVAVALSGHRYPKISFLPFQLAEQAEEGVGGWPSGLGFHKVERFVKAPNPTVLGVYNSLEPGMIK